MDEKTMVNDILSSVKVIRFYPHFRHVIRRPRVLPWISVHFHTKKRTPAFCEITSHEITKDKGSVLLSICICTPSAHPRRFLPGQCWNRFATFSLDMARDKEALLR